MRRFLVLAVLMLASIVLIGCGGGGGATQVTLPTVTLFWPTQTRDITAPEAAVRARITVTRDATSESVTWEVLRPSGTASQQIVTSGPAFSRGGDVTLRVEFFGQSTPDISAAGPVGRLVVPAHLADGGLITAPGEATPLTVTTQDMVQSVVLAAPTIRVGETKPVYVYGLTPTEDPQYLLYTALSDRYVDVTVVQGAENVEVARPGGGLALIGKGDGPCRLHISYRSLARDEDVNILPRATTFVRHNLEVSGLVWCEATSKLWVSFDQRGNPIQGALAELDPVSGQLTNVRSGFFDAKLLAVSTDGTVGYVMNGAGLNKVRLSDGVVLNTEYVGGVTTLYPHPGGADEYVLGYGGTGLAVVRGGTGLSEDPSIRYANPIGYLSPTRLAVLQDGALSIVDLTQTPLVAGSSQTAALGTPIIHSDKVVWSGLNVWSGSGLATHTPLSFGAFTATRVAASAGDTAVFLGGGDPLNQGSHVARRFDLSTGASLAAATIDGAADDYVSRVVSYGQDGLILVGSSKVLVVPHLAP